MAVPFITGVRDLVTELLADALIFLRMLQSAGAVSPCFLQSLTDHLYHFLILVQPNRHDHSPFMKNPPTHMGGWIGGECEIRTHGALPHHQFSRLAP